MYRYILHALYLFQEKKNQNQVYKHEVSFYVKYNYFKLHYPSCPSEPVNY